MVGELRRILLALDAATPAASSVDAAAEFARRISAELDALFVEDADLLQLAQLPFTTQVNRTTALRMPLDAAALEIQMRKTADAARFRLSQAATRHSVKWSFRTVRGRVVQELQSAAEGADLIVVEGGLHRVPAHLRMGSHTGAALRALSSRSVLVLRALPSVQGPPLVVYDGTERGERALRLAAQLVPEGARLRVCLLADNKSGEGAGSGALEARARTILGAMAAAADFEVASGTGPDALCGRAAVAHAGIVIAPADCACVAAADMDVLIERIPCPLLLVR